MKNTTLLILAVAFVCYLAIGGGVFHVLEYTAEQKRREETFKLHKDRKEHAEELFSDDYFDNETVEAADDDEHSLRPDEVTELIKNVKDYLDATVRNLTWEAAPTGRFNTTTRTIRLKHLPTIVLTPQELDDIIGSVWVAAENGIDPFSDEKDSSPPHWDFLPAMTFSMTVVTTIGYGATTPQTTGGRVFTIFYALLGIPLTAAFLSGLAGAMGDLIRRVTDAILRRHPAANPAAVSNVSCALCTLLGVGLFILLPAFVIHLVEDWTYLESIYFMFVSVSTIGFGDFVTGNQRKYYWEGYRVLTKAWIVAGLAFLAMIFDLISQAIKKVEDKIEEEEEPAAENSDGNVGYEGGETGGQGGEKVKDQEQQTEAVGGTDTAAVRARQGSGTRRPRVPIIMVIDKPAPASASASASGRHARQHLWQL